MSRNPELKAYVDILLESLQKKNAVMREITALNAKQSELLKKEPFDFDEFDKTMEEKEKLAEKLNDLDDGFESIYGRIREEILSHKDEYQNQILAIQKQIREITDQNAAIQAQEARIRREVKKHSDQKSAELRQQRDSSKAVKNYYQVMNKLGALDAQFMDRKN